MVRLKKFTLWGIVASGLAVTSYLYFSGKFSTPSPDAQRYFSKINVKTETGDYIPAAQLGNSDYCGHCHRDVFQQWNASAHHFSSFNNPFYRKVALEVEAKKGNDALKFCANCHDPLPIASGEIEDHKSNMWSANAGITCLACHRITEIHGPNGQYVLSAPTLHPFAITENPMLQKFHSALVNLTPWLHRKALTQDFYSEPEFCATCHTLVVPQSLNGVNDITLLNEFGHWKNSRFSGKHSISGVQQDSKSCSDCHMPLVESNDPAAKNGLIKSHRFPGGHTILPTMNRDFTQLKTVEKFLQDQKVIVSIVGIRIPPQLRYLDPDQVVITKSKAQIELAVRISNVGVGHTFPAGTVDSNEAWLEFIALDSNAQVVHHSGGLDDNKEIIEGSHLFKATFVDAVGNKTDRRNTTTEAVTKAASSVIESGTSTIVYEMLTIPANAVFPIELKVKLNWRKYNPAFVQWVYDGRTVPELPITIIAQSSIQLKNSSVQ
ncbi:hypothetical protein MNBD_GAMMA21-2737 [hydrothermal vent metagenome]|uniref:Cytochrome c-552/4 domain-containing protein n=1 Tax=hydrothermal vent metagenome TaxID=652676 RepID=A0A3B1A0Q8_9ZZZZ